MEAGPSRLSVHEGHRTQLNPQALNAPELEMTILGNHEGPLHHPQVPFDNDSWIPKNADRQERSINSVSSQFYSQDAKGKGKETHLAQSTFSLDDIAYSAYDIEETTASSNGNESRAHLGANQVPKLTIDQATSFWENYNKAADFEDREFVKAVGVNMDTLLIFAGIFSAVNTAFILESLKTIQPDHAERTSELVRSVVQLLQNSTTPDHLSHDEPYKPEPHAVRSTVFFFSSLCCSLTAAFGAVLGKQWLGFYEREGRLKPPPDRARVRQRKYEGRYHWHLEGVVETLPTILQTSLFLFLIAMIDFLWHINRTVAAVALGFSVVPVLFYIVTTIIATIHPASPFQTRLSITLRQLPSKIPQQLGRLARLFRPFARGLDRVATFILTKAPEALQTLFLLVISILWGPFYLLLKFTKLISRRLSEALSSSNANKPISDSGDILNLNCLIFYMKRASTPQDIDAILIALSSLPTDLQVDRNHPIVTSFAETMLKFLLKPSWQAGSRDTVVWGTPQVDLRLLLHILHLIYVRWGYTLNFSSLTPPSYHNESSETAALHISIRKGIWPAFSDDPSNLPFVSLVADIMIATGTRGPTDCPEFDLETICRCLANPLLAEGRYLPYISLLSHTSFAQISNYARRPEFDSVSHTLTSGMWKNGVADLHQHRGYARAAWLSTYLRAKGSADEYRFSEYLLQWLNSFNKRQNVVQCYLDSITQLLQSEATDQWWAQKLEQDGHVESLLWIIQEWKEWAQADNAIYCFLSLWRKRVPPTSPNATISSVYMNPDTLRIAFGFWKGPGFLIGLGDAQRTGIMELIVLYAEEASRLGRLGLDMEFITERLQVVVRRNLRGEPEHQRALSQRAAGLVFLTSNG